MHATEVKFYNIFKNKLPEILPKVYFTQLWVPTEHQGCLHMEDLSKRGTSLNYYDCLNHGQIRSIIRGLAYFHKEVMCCDKAEWEGKFPVREEFIDKMDKAFVDFTNMFMSYVKDEGYKFDCRSTFLIEMF